MTSRKWKPAERKLRASFRGRGRKTSESQGLRKGRGIRKTFLATVLISTIDMFAGSAAEVNCSAGLPAEVETVAAEVVWKWAQEYYIV